MTWDGTILRLGGTLADGDHIQALTLPRSGAPGTFAEAHLSFGAQMGCQLLLEHPSRLDEQAAIDRFMRYPHAWIAWVRSLQPTRNLLWRPLQCQLLRHPPP